MNVPVQKIAGILNLLLGIALVCNVIILYLVPTAVFLGGGDGLLGGVRTYFATILFPGEDDIVMAGIFGTALMWFWCWAEFDAYQIVLMLFLVFSGFQTLCILRQARRVVGTILAGNPFSAENGDSLYRAARNCFLIAAAALVRVVFNVAYYRSAQPLASYNALFVPIFAMAGLLCLVMSALFRQAAEMKAENDLTI
ncbi:MAG: DUF2975 domain-containing protein [Oscillibacter sp.]|nr:DUF2975 domain-containing protein [Oscillibacter sp.]